MTDRLGPRIRALLLSLLVVGAGAACASTQEASEPGATGCYQFVQDDAAGELGLPWGFELLPGSLEGWSNIPDGHPARTRVAEASVRDHPFAFWRVTRADSIQVGHPGGGGFSLTLALEGRDLVGTARPVGDVVLPGEDFGPREARRVTALRVLCPEVGEGRSSGR